MSFDVIRGHEGLMIAIIVGLVLGKPLSLTLACALAVRSDLAVKPECASLGLKRNPWRRSRAWHKRCDPQLPMQFGRPVGIKPLRRLGLAITRCLRMHGVFGLAAQEVIAILASHSPAANLAMLKVIEFQLSGEFIALDALLKTTGIATSGGEAKAMVAAEKVHVDGQLELRKRCKIRPGQIVSTGGSSIRVVARS